MNALQVGRIAVQLGDASIPVDRNDHDGWLAVAKNDAMGALEGFIHDGTEMVARLLRRPKYPLGHIASVQAVRTYERFHGHPAR